MQSSFKHNFRYCLTCITALTLCLLSASCAFTPSVNPTIRACLNTEPTTLDPRFVSSTDAETVILQIYEGLVTFTSEGTIIPAGSTAWEISDDGLTYIFHLRENASWSNGDPITADDYVLSWQTALSSESKNPNPYISNLYCIKNGKLIHSRQKAASELGIKALDKNTLAITLEQHTPYFLPLLTTPMFYPLHASTRVMKADNNTTDNIISNGPFKIAKWQHHNRIELIKNESYWDNSNVRTPKLTFFISDSSSTRLSLFENNQLDIFLAPPNIDIQRLKKEGKLQIRPILSTYFYYFNTTKPPLNNVNVRKALTLAANRMEIIRTITKGEQKPALAFVPYGFSNGSDNSDFRYMGGNYFHDNDVALAKKLLAEAGYPNGQNFPAVTILYDISEENQAIAQALQSTWKKSLNIDVTLVSQEWKTFYKNVGKMDFDIARARWIADFPDPFSFLQLFDSDLTVSKGGWQNKTFNQLLKSANESTNTAARMLLLHNAENILMEDYPIMPIFFYNDIFCTSTRLKGIEHNALGQIYYRHAYKI